MEKKGRKATFEEYSKKLYKVNPNLILVKLHENPRGFVIV